MSSEQLQRPYRRRERSVVEKAQWLYQELQEMLQLLIDVDREQRAMLADFFKRLF